MKRVYIKELGGFGEVISTDKATGAARVVEVSTPEGPKMVDVIEKGYTIISTLKAIWNSFYHLLKVGKDEILLANLILYPHP